jgi:hypothetical protein
LGLAVGGRVGSVERGAKSVERGVKSVECGK